MSPATMDEPGLVQVAGNSWAARVRLFSGSERDSCSYGMRDF